MNSIPAPAPPRVVRLADPMPPGTSFVRAMLARAVHPDNIGAAEKYAAARWGADAAPLQILKAAVSAGTVSDIGTLAPFVEFVNAVRAQSVVGPLLANGLRRRPVETRYLTDQGPMQGTWVAEGDSIPILPVSFEQASLKLLKVGGIVVLTDEAIQSTDPASEQGIRRDIISGLAEAIDTAFLDPGNPGIAGQTPASVTSALTPIAIGTGDLDDVRQGISRMIEEFQGDLSAAVFVGSPQLFAMLHSQGFEDVGLRGGTLIGSPAVATKAMPATLGRYALALIDPTGIGYTDDPAAAQVVASRNAAVEMADNPTGDSTTPTPRNLISLFQCNCTALKGVLHANWAVEREGAVSLMLAFPEALAS